MRGCQGKPETKRGGLASEPDDLELVRRAQADSEAFDALFDRFWIPVRAYCYRRLGSLADADDAAQHAMIEVARALPSFGRRSGPQNARSWVFAIAHAKLVDAERWKRRNAHMPFPEDAYIAARAPSPEDEAVFAETHHWLHTLFTLLPPDQRDVMELRAAELETHEIAEVLGKREGAVRKLTERARARLMELPVLTEGGRHV
jgi:RNA polymerase sigma-70 factor (ECF subfamily)